MKSVNISASRRFSLQNVQRSELASVGQLRTELLCFEAGQSESSEDAAGAIYQVLEGEAIFRQAGQTERVGKGRLLAVEGGQPVTVENAGGGLLVVLVATSG